MKSKVRIKSASLRDLAGLAELFDRYRQFYRQPSDLAAAKVFLRRRIAKKESLIFVAEVEGRLVGFVQLYPVFSSIRIRRALILNDLFVLETNRRQGVAVLLMHQAIAAAKDAGAAYVTLETAASNHGAKALYDHLGFTRDNSFEHYTFAL